MFNPHIFSRSEVNQTQGKKLSPDLFVATVNMDINIFLSCPSARNSIAICHLLSSRNFFPYGPTIQGCLCVPHFSYVFLNPCCLFI